MNINMKRDREWNIYTNRTMRTDMCLKWNIYEYGNIYEENGIYIYIYKYTNVTGYVYT